MKTTVIGNKMSIFTRVGGKLPLLGVTLAFGLGLALAGQGCSNNEGQEGDYCNYSLDTNASDECASGLSCTAASQGPPTPNNVAYYDMSRPVVFADGTPNPIIWAPNAPCPENYCCPIAGGSTNPVCQPGCGGGAASICAADPTAGPASDPGWTCEAAEAIEAGAPLPAVDSGAPPVVDAAPEAAPDAAPDAVADAPADAPDGG